MLKSYRTHESPPDAEGVVWMISGPEIDDVPCQRCGGESVPNICEGDGRYHHHGRVHTVAGGLEALCRPCATVTAAGEWEARRHHGKPDLIQR